MNESGQREMLADFKQDDSVWGAGGALCKPRQSTSLGFGTARRSRVSYGISEHCLEICSSGRSRMANKKI